MAGRSSKDKKGGKGGSKEETPPDPPTEEIAKINALLGKDEYALVVQQRRWKESEDKVGQRPTASESGESRDGAGHPTRRSGGGRQEREGVHEQE